MAIDSIYSSSTKTRISGLSSGWDTDQMVAAMVQNDKARVTKAYQALTRMEYKKDAYRSINSILTSFNNGFLSVAGANSVKAASTFRAFAVKVDGNSSVKISASNNAATGNYKISVQQTAEGVSIKSSTTVNANFNSNKKLSELGIDFDAMADGENTDVSFVLSNNSAQKEIIVSKNDTVGSLIKKINSSNLGITATISEISGKLTITSNETGAAAAMSLSEVSTGANGVSTNVLGSLGFDIANPAEYTPGRDAQYTINGYAHTSSTNRFTIDGLTIELTEPSNGDINFSVDKDTSSVVDAVKTFVNNLNTLYSTLNKLLTEKVYRSYPPLSPDDKSGMNESDIAKWDAKAKSGIVSGDSKINSLLSEIRSAFLSKVPGTDLTFADIGITTKKYSDRESGEGVTWEIDTAKLQKALEEHPEAVEKMFTQDTYPSTNRYAESGLAARMAQAVTNFNNKVRDTGYKDLDFDKKISDLNSAMSRANSAFYKKQEAAYAKLAAMETALSKLQSQSNWLVSQLGGGQ